MIGHVRKILKIPYETSIEKQYVGYDTKFELGDYYVSWLCLRDIMRVHLKSRKPMILPVIQVIHERKLQWQHNIAFDTMCRETPELGTQKFVSCSDDEFTGLNNIN